MLSNPQSIDILGICETFLNEKTPDSFLTIKGFNAKRKDFNFNFKNSKPILACSAYRPPSSRREWIENFAKEIKLRLLITKN